MGAREVLAGEQGAGVRQVFGDDVDDEAGVAPRRILPHRADQFLKELGSPENAFNFNASLKHGAVTFGYKLNYLDHMLTSTYENFFSKNGKPPQNPDVNNIEWYHSRWYHNVRAAIDVGRKYNFYLGIDNLTNALPPLGLTGVGGAAVSMITADAPTTRASSPGCSRKFVRENWAGRFVFPPFFYRRHLPVCRAKPISYLS